MPSIDSQAKVMEPTVVQGSITADAVTVKAKAIATADLPEELADRVVDYVRSVGAPGGQPAYPTPSDVPPEGPPS